jgi:hypothetical protein
LPLTMVHYNASVRRLFQLEAELPGALPPRRFCGGRGGHLKLAHRWFCRPG